MKKIILGTVCLLLMLALTGCQFVEDVVEETKSDMEWAQEVNAYTDGKKPDFGMDEDDSNYDGGEILHIGDTGYFETEDTTISVTVTETGYTYSSMYDQSVIYFTYTIENTGNNQTTIGDIFSAYNDDVAVEKDYIEKDSFSVATIDAGRKCNGKTYLLISPEQVGRLEVQVASAVWLLSSESGNDDGSDSVTVLEEYVDAEELKGKYKDSSSGMTLDLQINLDTGRDDLGVFALNDPESGTLIAGNIVAYDMNVYSLYMSAEEIGRVYVVGENNGEYELYYEDTRISKSCYLTK